MKISSLLSIAIGSFLLSQNSFAWLAKGSFSGVSLSLHAMYTSSDPTCQTGLTATIPMTKTAKAVNAAAGVSIGTGTVSSTINCIVLVVDNTSTVTWSSGSYSTTSVFAPGNSTFNDSNCNTGASSTNGLCNGNSVTWPTTIATDLATAGLTATSTCTGTATEVIPLYISTYSKCTGIYAVDVANVNSTGNAGITGCTWTSSSPYRSTNFYQPPTATGDTTKGMSLCGASSGTCSAPASSTSYKLVSDPSYMVGGNGGSSCGGLGPPVFSFAVK